MTSEEPSGRKDVLLCPRLGCRVRGEPEWGALRSLEGKGQGGCGWECEEAGPGAGRSQGGPRERGRCDGLHTGEQSAAGSWEAP